MPPLARASPWWVGLALCVALAGCARVPAHRTLPSLPVAHGSFPATLEGLTGAPVSDGNAVQILLNGDEIFPAQLAAIRAARASITYAQYFYGEGAAPRETAEALAERCRAGVDVAVLLDGIGSFFIPEEFDRLLREAGCRLVYFRPLRQLLSARANYRNHRRILVVDGRVGFTGGSGMSHQWEGGGRTAGQWRDTDVRIEGPAVRYLQGAFAESWLEATGEVLGGPAHFPEPLPVAGRTRAQIVSSSPATDDFALYTTMLLAIEGARQTVHITNPYFAPDERMTAALRRAVARGVRVVVLVPGDTDWHVVRLANWRALGCLIEEGVEIHQYTAALLHAKTMVVDGVWATVGSTNFDSRSFAFSSEINAVFYDPAVAERLDRIFSDDLAHARQVSCEEWRARSLWRRLLELLAWPLGQQL